MMEARLLQNIQELVPCWFSANAEVHCILSVMKLKPGPNEWATTSREDILPSFYGSKSRHLYGRACQV